MKDREFRVEFTHIDKKYAHVVVQAETEKKAIDKVRELNLKLEDFDDSETASQSQWVAVSNFSFLGWLKSLFR